MPEQVAVCLPCFLTDALCACCAAADTVVPCAQMLVRALKWVQGLPGAQRPDAWHVYVSSALAEWREPATARNIFERGLNDGQHGPEFVLAYTRFLRGEHGTGQAGRAGRCEWRGARGLGVEGGKAAGRWLLSYGVPGRPLCCAVPSSLQQMPGQCRQAGKPVPPPSAVQMTPTAADNAPSPPALPASRPADTAQEENARAVFERMLAEEGSACRRSLRVWAAYLELEVQCGQLAAVAALEARAREALGQEALGPKPALAMALMR